MKTSVPLGLAGLPLALGSSFLDSRCVLSELVGAHLAQSIISDVGFLFGPHLWIFRLELVLREPVLGTHVLPHETGRSPVGVSGHGR